MIHILLWILKIIGIILLSILGILILAVLGLLFVPVRYRIEAVRKEGEGEPPAAVRIKITWLLHLLNALICYAGELNVRIRVIIFSVYRFPKRDRDVKKQRKTKEQNEKSSAIQNREADEKDVETHRKETDGEDVRRETLEDNRKETTAGIEDTAEERREANEEGAKDDSREADETKKSGFFEKILAVFQKVKDLFVNIQYTIRHFCDKIKSAWNAVEFRYEVLTSDHFREAWELCQKELGRVVRSIKPRKFEADIIVGMEDPAATGEILAVCGMLYPLIGSHVNVSGDFEQKRLEGRIFVKGRISGFVLLWAGFQLYRNKNLKNVYGLLKKGGSVDG